MSDRGLLMGACSGVSAKPKGRATYGKRKGVNVGHNLFSIHERGLTQGLPDPSPCRTALTEREDKTAASSLILTQGRAAPRLNADTLDSTGNSTVFLGPGKSVYGAPDVSQTEEQTEDKRNVVRASHARTMTVEGPGHSASQSIKSRRPGRVRAIDSTEILAFDLSTLSESLPSTESRSTRTSKSKISLLQAISNEDSAALRPLLEVSALARPLSFCKYGNSIEKFYHVKKIGEGTYSSVFELKRKHGVCVEKCPNESTILKVMPLLLPTQQSRNSSLPADKQLEGLTSAADVVKELHTMRALDPLPGFLRYRGVALTTGVWPASFIDSFRKYRQRHPSKAFNADPEQAYQPSQCYAIIEMGHAGIEVDEIRRPSDFLIYDVFWQTALNLARAEEVAEFEHRDMHISNICVSSPRTEVDIDTRLVEEMHQKPSFLLGLTGARVVIIDYTYSRVQIQHRKETLVNYRDCEMHSWANDESAATKLEDRLQLNTYTRQASLIANSSTSDEHEWQLFNPGTNIAWLSYLLQTLLSRAGKIKRTKYVTGSSDTAVKIQDRLRSIMTEVRDLLLDTEQDNRQGEVPSCTTQLIEIAIERDWLTQAEIEEYQRTLNLHE